MKRGLTGLTVKFQFSFKSITHAWSALHEVMQSIFRILKLEAIPRKISFILEDVKCRLAPLCTFPEVFAVIYYILIERSLRFTTDTEGGEKRKWHTVWLDSMIFWFPNTLVSSINADRAEILKQNLYYGDQKKKHLQNRIVDKNCFKGNTPCILRTVRRSRDEVLSYETIVFEKIIFTGGNFSAKIHEIWYWSGHSFDTTRCGTTRPKTGKQC